MKNGPDIARVAALIGDPARANMLTALMDGRALTARELAEAAGVTPQTASGHLAQLVQGGLLAVAKQGRHRYARLAGPEVAAVLEALMGFSGQATARTRTGPRDGALRQARVCYNHLAGAMGVQMYDSLVASGALHVQGEGLALTDAGAARLAGIGFRLEDLPPSKAPMCRSCLDWSERRTHLAGRLGRGLLVFIEAQGWAGRDPDSRAMLFTPNGQRLFHAAFGR